MVDAGDADGTIGGAVYSTPDIVRAALRVIGTATGTKILSSFFFIIFKDRVDLPSQVNIFADCGLVIDPDAQELADIAISSAGSMKSLTGIDPKIAMARVLKYSSFQRFEHSMVLVFKNTHMVIQNL